MATVTEYVDYGQTAEDHQSLLVLVLHVGSQLQPQSYHHAYDKISRIDCIHVQGQKRDITVRYRKNYSVDFNSWGDFQTHRKVYGIIVVGKCTNHAEFDELFAGYKKIKEEYASTIINSRLIVFGMNTDGSPIANPEDVESAASDDAGNEDDEEDEGISFKSSDDATEETQTVIPKPEPEIAKKSTPGEQNGVKPNHGSGHRRTQSLTMESTGAEVVFYPSLDKCFDLEDRIKEFVTSLFYVLEGKRLDRSFERSDKLTLLCAPFEKKDYVGVDTDTKSFRKKCMGRLRKHLGDLCLQAAMPGEAVLHYNTALDILRGVNDFLWMGGCYEGMSCAAIVLAYPKAPPSMALRRNLSFQVKRGSPLAETKARSGTGSHNGLEALNDKSGPAPNLDNVVEKYKDAINLYSKFKHAAVIEMEACLKACRLLILQRKFLHASDFLQNVVYINLPSGEDDRIARYNTLSCMYSQIGMRRKAAFYKRVSGMHCVAPDRSPTKSSWLQCYDLMLQCLEGYSLSVNPRTSTSSHNHGWPDLQRRVLRELVFSARKISNPHIAVRHMTLLVDSMLRHMSVNDQREALASLSQLTLKCPGTPQPLALDSGLRLPPVPLLALPTVKTFRLLPPAPHLQATKLATSASCSGSSGIFIYTPMSLSSSRAANDSKPDFLWVSGDVCEASLQLSNPLADELKIFYMGLMVSEGVEVEVFPANPVIAANSGLVTVKLMLKPKSAGTLVVLGYTSIVFGVKSNCRLRDLPKLKPAPMSEISVEVVPPLPHLALSCSLPKATTFISGSNTADVINSGSATLFAGQSLEATVTVQNTSCETVETLSVTSRNQGGSSGGDAARVVKWVDENIESQLPIGTTATMCFSLYLYGDSHFLQVNEGKAAGPQQPSNKSRSDTLDAKEKCVETIVSLQYSGGEGRRAGYCRQCALALCVDIVASVYIKRWDVQHTADHHTCRLALELLNVSGHEMEVKYGRGDDSVDIADGNTRRIILEVPRLVADDVELQDVVQNRVPAHYRSNKLTPDPYSQCLAKHVDIRWTMPSSGTCGVVTVDYLTWTPEQLEVLLTSDIRWDVKFGGQAASVANSRLSYRVGELVSVNVVLENVSAVDKGSAVLSLQPCQKSRDGDLGVDRSGMAVIGMSDLQIEQIPANSCVSHSCSFVFFAPGLYGISATCQLTDLGHGHDHSPSSDPQNTSTERENGCETQKNSSRHSNNLWTYTSPVRFEIT